MSRGLKELKELIIKLKSLGYTRCDEWLGLIIIEKELKALEIIRKLNKESHNNVICLITNSTEEANSIMEVLNA